MRRADGLNVAWERVTAARLLVARIVSWGLLLLGWTVLGVYGRQWAPLWIGGMAPLVAWLAAIGLSLWLGRGRVLPPLVLRVFVVACGGVAALLTALLPMGGATLIAGAGLSPSTLLLVVGVAAVWGLLLVLASRVVKGLRTRLASSTVAGLSLIHI